MPASVTGLTEPLTVSCVPILVLVVRTIADGSFLILPINETMASTAAVPKEYLGTLTEVRGGWVRLVLGLSLKPIREISSGTRSPAAWNALRAVSYTHLDVYKRQGRGRIIAMHLKETVPGKFREIPFGTGHVDFEKGIRKAWELGVRRYVTEFWYTGNPDWEQDLDYAARTMSAILDRQS